MRRHYEKEEKSLSFLMRTQRNRREWAPVSSVVREYRPRFCMCVRAFAFAFAVVHIFTCWCLSICRIAQVPGAHMQQVWLCKTQSVHSEPSFWLCTSHACWMSSFPIISFKSPSHTIIQFSLLDNDHFILIWQVDYTASHTRLLMLRKRLWLLDAPSRLDGLL